MEKFLMLGLTLLLGAAACYTDLRTGKIPNKLTFAAILAGVIMNLVFGDTAGLISSLKGFAVGFALLLIPYFMGGIGAGDVKLLAAIGALQGPYFVFISTLVGAVVGGMMAWVINELRFLSYGGAWSLTSLHLVRINPVTGKMSFPYGVALFVGLLYTSWYLF